MYQYRHRTLSNEVESRNEAVFKEIIGGGRITLSAFIVARGDLYVEILQFLNNPFLFLFLFSCSFLFSVFFLFFFFRVNLKDESST